MSPEPPGNVFHLLFLSSFHLLPHGGSMAGLSALASELSGRNTARTEGLDDDTRLPAEGSMKS